MKKKIIYKNLILPLSIIMSSIIFGAFLYKIQIAKQESIERQQLKELELTQLISNEESVEKEKEQEQLKICTEYAFEKRDEYGDLAISLARKANMTIGEWMNNFRDERIRDCMLIKGYAGY